MPYSSAADFAQVQDYRRRVAGDPSRSLVSKARALADVQREIDKPEPRRGMTFGDVFRGAIGAAAGYGIARGAANAMNVDPEYKGILSAAGAGLGALMNSGMLKRGASEEERTHAFRFGFVKAARDVGYFAKESAFWPIPTVPISPGSVMAIPRGLAGAAARGGQIVGSAIGAADAPDEDEVELAEIQVQKALLEEQLDRLKSERRNRALKRLLAERREQR